jgi:hypothetical protein
MDLLIHQSSIKVDDEEEEEEEMSSTSSSTGNARNRRKKEKKLIRKREQKNKKEKTDFEFQPSSSTSTINPSVIVDYVMPKLSELEGSSDPELALIYKQFIPTSAEETTIGHDEKVDDENYDEKNNRKTKKNLLNEEEEREEEEEEENVGDSSADSSLTSRRQRKKQLYSNLALLKREVLRPDVVEAHDVNSYDPKLLVYLKSLRNTVPVPRHWCHKAKYLQGKKGLIKPVFQLPEFITATGITRLRTTDLDKNDTQTLKAKTRERVQPKMGRIEIEYQVLHDAFFIHQTKPKLSSFGDLYYEGKELEKTNTDKKPGILSSRLRIALGMQAPPMEGVEGNAASAFNASSTAIGLNTPPPWLVNMQRYGPPPSYAGMRIPGLNAPIPQGARFGFGPGEWGRPPVDEHGTPLYGDVFGQQNVEGGSSLNSNSTSESVGTGAVKNLWGAIRTIGIRGGMQTSSLSTSSSSPSSSSSTNEPSTTTEAIEQASLEMSKEGHEVEDTTQLAAATTTISKDESNAEDGTNSTFSTRPESGGLSTNAAVELRKGSKKGADSNTTNDTASSTSRTTTSNPPKLYTVLEERKTELSGGLLGTKTAYIIPPSNTSSSTSVVSTSNSQMSSSSSSNSNLSSITTGNVVNITLNPEDLSKLDEAEIAKLYDQEAARVLAAKAAQKEDFSDLINEQEKKRANLAKRKGDDGGGGGGGGGGGKKAKKGDFKF